MNALVECGRAICARRAKAVRERVAAELDALPGIAAEVEGQAVLLAGPGLTRRALVDPALREIGR